MGIRYALRQLWKAPGFALTAIVTLALGIGANTAIFTLVHAVLLKSLPVADPAGLVRVGDRGECCVDGGVPNDDNDYSLFAYDLYLHLKNTTPEFAQLAAMQAGTDMFTVRPNTPGAVAKSLHAEFVSGNYFETLGLRPYVGRTLLPSDERDGAAPVAVLSYSTWQRDFGGSAAVVGSTMEVDTHPVTIVGVAPPSFYGDRMTDSPPGVYLPVTFEQVTDTTPYLHLRHVNWLYLLGRPRPGVQLPLLTQKLSAHLRDYLATVAVYQRADEAKNLRESHVVLTPGGLGIENMQEQYRVGLRLLTGVSALVLLIACANLANLLLVRGMARAAEMSLRMALGAERLRIVRQLLMENLVLAALGGAAGLAVAYVGTRTLLLLAFPASMGLPIAARPSAPVLLFSLGLTAVTGLVFGLLPAWITSRAQPAEALRGAHRTTSAGAPLLQRVLVVGQASLSLVLLVGAGLMAKTLANLEHQDLGLTTANRVIVHIDPQAAGYKPEQLESLYRELHDRMAALPGVKRVSLSLHTPLEGGGWGEGIFLAGRPEPHPGDNVGARWLRVSPEFFDMVGQRVVSGRGIGVQDTPQAPGVAVVNQAFLRRFFARGENPIGQQFGVDEMKSAHDFTIVGVVSDAKYQSPREAVPPMYFRPLLQLAASDPKGDARSLYVNNVMFELSGPQAGFEGEVRRTLASINPNLTVVDYGTFEHQIASQFNQERLLARLTELFGLLALLLASVGLYGVTAYTVARRTSEIGVRMALGADRASVVRMVLRGALAQAGLGLAIGVPVALGAARFLNAELYGLHGSDPLVLLAAAGSLGVAATLAAALPARRAAGMDPMAALRAE